MESGSLDENLGGYERRAWERLRFGKKGLDGFPGNTIYADVGACFYLNGGALMFANAAASD